MQLDLFEDNRPGILLNIADEFILSRKLDQAVSVYEQLLSDYPEDRSFVPLLKLVEEWRNLLAAIIAGSAVLQHITDIWLCLDTLTYPALRFAVLGSLIDAVRAVPEPELLYVPPRLHLGRILMEAGRYSEAVQCFQAALSKNIIEPGRFLAWRGDALTLDGNNDAALKSYLAAFLEDPISVDKHSITNRKITDLHTSLHAEAADEIEEEEEPAWLPVWGWLQGVFTLPLQPAPDQAVPEAAEFEGRIAEANHAVPRIWFEMLTQAERLRCVQRDDRELAAVRRLMKRSNGFMFACYLEKLGSNRTQGLSTDRYQSTVIK
jgi:tetratricopeptide (TPR) repeat protein